MMVKRMTAASLKCLCAQWRALENLFSHAAVYTHVDPCRDDRVTGMTVKHTDRQLSFELYIVDKLHM